VVAAGLSLRNQDLRNLKVAATSFSIGGVYPPLADSFIKSKPEGLHSKDRTVALPFLW
jgi:hypothetical protein